MAQSIRTLSMHRLVAYRLRPAAKRAYFPVPTFSTRRSYSVEDKAKESEPGGQRRLIITSVLAVAGVGVLWLRGGKDDISGAGHGANQEYKQNAEGNK